jgi:hypothetical protein
MISGRAALSTLGKAALYQKGDGAMNKRISFLKGVLALILIFSVQGWAVGAEQGQHHSMHGPQPGHMSAAEQQFYQDLEKEKAASVEAPAGVQYQGAGPALLDALTNRLDGEIEKAGGSLGGYVSGAEAHAVMQGIPLRISDEEAVTQGGRCPSGVPVKTFDISAINAEITINRFIDYFPV